MRIDVRTASREYPVYTGRGILEHAGRIIEENAPGGRVFIISESGVPARWRDMLAEALGGPDMYIFPQGEANKNLTVYGDIIRWLAEVRASRRDVIAAIGGGVTGDLAGFAAATYMRGIRYVNIPTTALSQIDSGIGGKTAIDHAGIKNIAGAFWQPSAVIADTLVLGTLPARQMSNGLAEAVKAGLIRDRELFGIFERDDYQDHLDEIIARSLAVKRDIVEEDEGETSVRKLLNFGHTFGHAYESCGGGRYLHGECVAMGMMTVLRDGQIRQRLSSVLERLSLPETYAGGDGSAPDAGEKELILSRILNDKKAAAGRVDMVFADVIGDAHIESTAIEDIRRMLL